MNTSTIALICLFIATSATLAQPSKAPAKPPMKSSSGGAPPPTRPSSLPRPPVAPDAPPPAASAAPVVFSSLPTRTTSASQPGQKAEVFGTSFSQSQQQGKLPIPGAPKTSSQQSQQQGNLRIPTQGEYQKLRQFQKLPLPPIPPDPGSSEERNKRIKAGPPALSAPLGIVPPRVNRPPAPKEPVTEAALGSKSLLKLRSFHWGSTGTEPPVTGFKVRVVANGSTAMQIVGPAIDALNAYNAAAAATGRTPVKFKVQTTAKDDEGDPVQKGKFVTIYPVDNNHLVDVVKALSQSLHNVLDGTDISDHQSVKSHSDVRLVSTLPIHITYAYDGKGDSYEITKQQAAQVDGRYVTIAPSPIKGQPPKYYLDDNLYRRKEGNAVPSWMQGELTQIKRSLMEAGVQTPPPAPPPRSPAGVTSDKE